MSFMPGKWIRDVEISKGLNPEYVKRLYKEPTFREAVRKSLCVDLVSLDDEEVFKIGFAECPACDDVVHSLRHINGEGKLFECLFCKTAWVQE